MDNLIITISGIAAILFIVWFFFGNKDEATVVDKSATITVSGGYSPSTIVVQKGKTTDLTFLRTDPSSCLEEVVLPEFKIKKFLPLNQKVHISLTPKQAGEYVFSCGMNMYHGKVVVKA